MDVMPPQDPESRQPSEPFGPTEPSVPSGPAVPSEPSTSFEPSGHPLDPPHQPHAPAEGATALPPPAPTLRTTLRRAALGAVAAGVLVAGALVAVPDGGRDAGPRTPGPVERAEAAATAGSPASLSDLTALIGDRQKWVKSHPADAPSWAALGAAYVEWGRRSADTAYYGRAEDALKRSLAAEPGERGNTRAWVGLAALANARHDFLAAKRWGETVKARQPGAWSVYPVLIDAYEGLGDRTAATAATEKFGELRKGVPALGRTADLYRGQGWREDALALAREAADLATAPAEKAGALHRLGELAWERGEPEEALAQFDAALRTDPGSHASQAGRARALAALERPDEALAAYQKAVATLPRPQDVLELAELYESLELDGDARTQYAKLADLLASAQAAGVDESLVAARHAADHGEAEKAVELMRGQWAKRHRSAAVCDALGWALHRAGRSQEGLRYARRALDTGVRNASYAYHLGVIERELGEYGPARRHLEEALRTNPDFSPLAAPAAREALDALGEPAPGGPGDGSPSPSPSSSPYASPSPVASAAASASASAEARPEPSPSGTRRPPAPTASVSAAAPAAGRAAAPAGSRTAASGAAGAPAANASTSP